MYERKQLGEDEAATDSSGGSSWITSITNTVSSVAGAAKTFQDTGIMVKLRAARRSSGIAPAPVVPAGGVLQSSNTMMYIGLGAGVLGLAGIAFMAMRNKSARR